MKRVVMFLFLVSFLLVSVAGYTQASKQFVVTATVPKAESLSVTLSRVSAANEDIWTSASNIAFGELKLKNGIFLSDYYFVADVGVNGGTPWTVQHSVGGDFANANGIGDNVNVTFVQQLTSNTEGWNQKYTIANSNRSYTNTQLGNGWLRVYYGIATGEAGTPGNPITGTEQAKTYSGTVTFTLVQ
ncbi:MAG: hypothetical protein JXD21_05390 [Candidatus Omnitrophica bacterium]|nr:hypothetical protein [Candidatus Omnitrophota bacterium]